jgi:hypothetical protein
LKLKTSAVAVLTLGPRMCKDKFMQAAGRLRKLGRGQKLIVAATGDVMSQVRLTSGRKECEEINVIDVLQWTVRNTIESNAEGILPWAKQGYFHATSYGNPDLVVEEEPSYLEQLYGDPFTCIRTLEAARMSSEHYASRLEKSRPSMLEVALCSLKQITPKVEEFDCRVVQHAGAADEECERELELERELEQEEELEIARLEPRHEDDWDFTKQVTTAVQKKRTTQQSWKQFG